MSFDSAAWTGRTGEWRNLIRWGDVIFIWVERDHPYGQRCPAYGFSFGRDMLRNDKSLRFYWRYREWRMIWTRYEHD